MRVEWLATVTATQHFTINSIHWFSLTWTSAKQILRIWKTTTFYLQNLIISLAHSNSTHEYFKHFTEDLSSFFLWSERTITLSHMRQDNMTASVLTLDSQCMRKNPGCTIQWYTTSNKRSTALHLKFTYPLVRMVHYSHLLWLPLELKDTHIDNCQGWSKYLLHI